jgi:hypothetical protein
MLSALYCLVELCHQCSKASQRQLSVLLVLRFDQAMRRDSTKEGKKARQKACGDESVVGDTHPGVLDDRSQNVIAKC